MGERRKLMQNSFGGSGVEVLGAPPSARVRALGVPMAGALSLSLLLVIASPCALFETANTKRSDQVTAIDLHPLLGPFPSPEAYFGCQRFDCFSGWVVTVYADKSSPNGRPYGGQYVSVQTADGWYVDSRRIQRRL